MSKDANQIAQEAARREPKVGYPGGPISTAPVPLRGTLTIWQDIHRMQNNEPSLLFRRNVVLDLTKPGLLVTYDAEGTAEILVHVPGWFIHFVPNRREGE